MYVSVCVCFAAFPLFYNDRKKEKKQQQENVYMDFCRIPSLDILFSCF